jgi:hypothetical protein
MFEVLTGFFIIFSAGTRQVQGQGGPANIINFQSISCQRSRTCSAYRDRIGNTQLCRRTLRKFDVAALLSIAVLSNVDLERGAGHRDDPLGSGG